jgi:hypothetical protein
MFNEQPRWFALRDDDDYEDAPPMPPGPPTQPASERIVEAMVIASFSIVAAKAVEFFYDEFKEHRRKRLEDEAK